MALRKLTTQELENLKNDSTFQAECRWAVRRYASYWSINDGAGFAGAALIKWAKDRQLSCERIEKDKLVENDTDIPIQYCKLFSAIDIDLAAPPLTPDVILPSLLPQMEAMTSKYYDLIGELINMALVGN